MLCCACTQQVAALISEMQQHLSDGRRGEIVRNGVRVAIAGVCVYVSTHRLRVYMHCLYLMFGKISGSSGYVQAHSSFTDVYQHSTQTSLRSFNAC
jgi:hypothetical protein